MAGLTLAGFLEGERTALDYLRRRCFPNGNDGQLKKRWAEAKGKLGPRWLDVGKPIIEPIPATHSEYLDKVKAHERYPETLQGMACEIMQVEIEPLIAFQLDVDFDRVTSACENLSPNPSIDDLLKRCLPLDNEKFNLFPSPAPDGNGVIIASDNPNMRPLDAEMLSVGQDGLSSVKIKIGARPPFVQVVKIYGRCFLKNGYHRAYGLRKLNVDKMPCLLLAASDMSQVGLVPGATIPENVLNRENGPTVGHYTEGRALSVPAVHKFHRKYIVGWAEIF
jgi:hypothetical protein